ncbi:MAG TPA: biotin/lipoate A/B protein ligase family protein [Candidatus Dormibacteraeota bacterium]|nr:biotin/lipoate A/B protein ligase family protein [Candidatus Dormibacteraeota bacterium]
MPEDPLHEATWSVIPAESCPAHMHMALDEALLEAVIAGERGPTMRLWSWSERALVIGSHQSVSNEVDLHAAHRYGFAVTRRMSGGGTMLCEPDRTITYSLYLPESMVSGVSFRKSYALLDAWAVATFNEMGVPASYREINDIISPRGKIAGAAQARRRGHVLHHTTIAHAMDVDLLPHLIRIGRASVRERGVRSAEKAVSPLSWFTELSCAEVSARLQTHFMREFDSSVTVPTQREVARARHLVASKYSTLEWINRLA